jgi:hypothetical protein
MHNTYNKQEIGNNHRKRKHIFCVWSVGQQSTNETGLTCMSSAAGCKTKFQIYIEVKIATAHPTNNLVEFQDTPTGQPDIHVELVSCVDSLKQSRGCFIPGATQAQIWNWPHYILVSVDKN